MPNIDLSNQQQDQQAWRPATWGPADLEAGDEEP